MIGDPGQIPPVVTIDVRRWETSPRAPHEAAPEVVLAEPALESVRFVGSLPACRRLPNESVDFVKPFYDFDFAAYVAAGARGRRPAERPSWRAPLADGRPLALTIPTPDHGPPDRGRPRDRRRGRERRERPARRRAPACDGDGPARPLDAGRHRRHEQPPRDERGARVGARPVGQRGPGRHAGALAGPRAAGDDRRAPAVGRDRPVGVRPGDRPPLRDGLAPSGGVHHADPRPRRRDACATTSRAPAGPGRPDVVGRGHDAHLRFWQQLEAAGSIVAVGQLELRRRRTPSARRRRGTSCARASA